MECEELSSELAADSSKTGELEGPRRCTLVVDEQLFEEFRAALGAERGDAFHHLKTHVLLQHWVVSGMECEEYFFIQKKSALRGSKKKALRAWGKK